MVIGVQTLDVAVFILCSANNLGKGINPIILFPAMVKIVRQTGIFGHGKEKENTRFKPVKLS